MQKKDGFVQCLNALVKIAFQPDSNCAMNAKRENKFLKFLSLLLKLRSRIIALIGLISRRWKSG